MCIRDRTEGGRGVTEKKNGTARAGVPAAGFLRKGLHGFPAGFVAAAVPELGANDDSSQSFSPYNNFYYIPQAELRASKDSESLAILSIISLPDGLLKNLGRQNAIR